MEYCSFWGISAPQLILLDLDIELFRDLVKYLNNSQDSDRLRSLLIEFELLQNFLENEIIYEYENADFRRKARQVKLSKEHYATGKDISKNMLLTEEQIISTEAILASAKKRIAPYIMRNGQRVDLSDAAVKIIAYIKSHIAIIEPYIAEIHINATKEIKVFNRRLEEVVYGKPEALRYRYMNKVAELKNVNLRKANVFLTPILSSIRKDIDVLLNAIGDGTRVVEEKVDNGVVISRTKSGTLQIANYPSCYPLGAKKLVMELYKAGVLKSLSQNRLIRLTQLYESILELNVDGLNLAFGLELTAEEYDKVFEELDSIGLVGLNNYCEQFLFNSLNSVALMKDIDATIYNEELKTVVFEIDRAISSVSLKYGEVIQ